MLQQEILIIALFIFLLGGLMSGFPIPFVLGGISLIFAVIGNILGLVDFSMIGFLPSRIFGIMTNSLYLAIPLFIFMGLLLERSKIAEELLETMGQLFGRMCGGLGFSVIIVGALLAASTGIVGATVVTMGLLSLPSMLKNGYSPKVSAGIICASGTLGQIIPPSIVLILLGDVISNAYQQAQLAQGNFSPKAVSIGDLFFGALFPGLGLVILYIIYVGFLSYFKPEVVPAIKSEESTKEIYLRAFRVLMPPGILIISVLGSILGGFATPTEAASIGCIGALILVFFKGRMNFPTLRDACFLTAKVTSQIYFIFLGATFLSLVFRALGGEEIITEFLHGLPGSKPVAFIVVMSIIFVLGFFLDFIEIIYIMVPLVAPALITIGFDPIWLGVMIAVNLQTSFLTPPFGFSLFYLGSVAPKSVLMTDIYKGVIPFIFLQLFMLVILWFFPTMTTWLPQYLFGK